MQSYVKLSEIQVIVH
jgi:hypothetical protein